MLAAVLKNDARTSSGRSRALSSLVVVQVALSLVLVAGAGLFVRTLRNLQQLDAGFTSDNVFVVQPGLGFFADGGATNGPSRAVLLDEVRRVPGVVTADFTTHTPLDGSAWSEAIVPAERPIPESDTARIISAGPAFFDALDITLLHGRTFAKSDVRGGPMVAIVNQQYAQREFPNQDPIGRRLASTFMGKTASLEIVGVVADVRYGGLRDAPEATVYVAFDQFDGALEPSLAIRTTGNGAQARERIRSALQRLNPDAIIGVQPMPAQVSQTLVQERMMATLASGFGVLALALSSIGLYGLLAYSVAQRSREIGIRMALGARASGVVADVLISGTKLVMIGCAVGLPAAWAASRSVGSMLFGLSPTDPVALAGAMLLLTFAALLASYLPARRAANVNPLRALRQD